MFRDRKEAGQLLVKELESFEGRKDVVILALVRGGVAVAHEIAVHLHLPLNVIIARKVGAPMNKELGIGAIAGDVSVYNEPLIKELEIDRRYIEEETKKKKQEALEKLKLYGKDKALPSLKEKVVILVDDGIATGITMEASVKFVRTQKAREVIIAVPVATVHSAMRFKKEVDRFVCLHTPSSMIAVGQFYDHFDQVSDEEVIAYLKRRT